MIPLPTRGRALEARVAPPTMIPRRALVVTATFLLAFLLYVDRVCISTAKVPIVAELGLSDAQFGWILSSFAFGYALLQAPAGMLADRYGARVTLAAVVGFWSLFTGATALAWNFISMMVVRFLFGAGEAGAFPGMARAVFSWIPVRERALVKGIKAKKSIATIMGEEFLEFVKALEGALEVPSEYEANKAASLKAILLGASDLVDALLGKAPEASDPAQLAMEDLTK